jgi:multidrug efflux pump subunit AcrA (membrane-fusion protein)
MRKIISIVIGILLIVAAVFAAKKIKAGKKKHKSHTKTHKPSVYTDIVKNKSIPVTITASGKLVAKNRVELFSEVQGILERSGRDFRAGNSYRKGELILKINNDEFYSALKAQRSSLLNQIIGLMPDLKLDYPESATQWEDYINSFNVSKPLAQLPKPLTNKEKYYITGKNIYTSFYNIKNLEIRLAKYKIYAPFSGTITDARVTMGTLVRPGQKLGTFISPRTYELEASVNSEFVSFLEVGKPVDLYNSDRSQSWKGKIIRINSMLDPKTQSIKVYIQVSDKNLKEGMFLDAELEAKIIDNVVEVSRKNIFNENHIFIVNDTTLISKEITPLYFKEKTVIIKGLEDGMKILKKPVPGAYDGMVIEEITQEK